MPENNYAQTDAPMCRSPKPPKGPCLDPLAVQDVVAKIAEIRIEDFEIVNRTLSAEPPKTALDTALPGHSLKWAGFMTMKTNKDSSTCALMLIVRLRWL